MKVPELGIIALLPAAWSADEIQSELAIAASRAGAIGVLDLEFLEDLSKALPAVKALVQNGRHGVGIRCSVEQIQGYDAILTELVNAECEEKGVILCVKEKAFTKKTLSQAISAIQKRKLAAFCEVVNVEEAQLAASAGADGLIATGHESGGRVGEETSFVLLQRCVHKVKIPVFVRGGIGIHTAGSVIAGGGAGVVLDNQLLLMRESSLSVEQKERMANFDGTETEVISCGSEKVRLYSKPGSDSLKALQDQLKASSKKDAELQEEFRKIVRGELKSANSGSSQLPNLLSMGQDIAFASNFARRFMSVGSFIHAIRAAGVENVELAITQNALAENAALAASQSTLYPILQGAMTRVSDVPDFAYNVANEGGLPFLALALMRKEELQPLLEQTAAQLGDKSWGVGMLGFVPNELRQEQLELVLQTKPPFALIAGGRPDQAKELEANGTKTYLHVPSPVLLASFIELGARKFIFEGKECGGHVGPRSSFVLWESMIDVLLNSIPPKSNPADFHVVFAGGIHDSVSASMVAVMAAPLVERGVRIGVLMGTAYLFTKEAVSSGAIVQRFQEEAIRCQETVLLETGPGHAIRCINSPYKDVFDSTKRKLQDSGCGKNELRQELEMMNLGRLRIASKGLARGESGSQSGSKLVNIPSDKQWNDGMYMIGQVAAMHEKTTTIKDLHAAVSKAACKHLESLDHSSKEKVDRKRNNVTPVKKVEEPIAIIGMSCLFPKANNLNSYWENILNKVDAIEEIPKEQFDWSKYYSADPLERDKISSRWGGFLRDIPFDPSIYGIPPSSLASVDPMQLIILEVTRAALADAGYQARQFNKERTSIVLANAGHGPITSFYSLRSMLDWTLSDMEPEYRKEVEKRLPEWTEDSFPGYLGNVVAGRVANRFDLGGINFCVDAACASSLAALYIGIRELRAGSSDVVLLAATDTHNQPGDYLSFSKTHALSPRGRCRTFDATADGIVISEGMAVLVLKRLSDAERDGDRIYSVIKGIGGSSDGRDLSLTAPRPAGQMLALRRAYEDADLSPSSVELVEAHGTGTVAGDKAEVEALRRIFEASGADKRVCAVGSVKTMIGHTKCAAGLASVIKVAKSLYHKVLPPTIGVETPNPACNFDDSPFYINSESRPWIHDKDLDYPRRAGVSAFGFGGTNFHTVLEEYTPQSSSRQDSAFTNFPTELFIFRAGSRQQLERTLDTLKVAAEKVRVLESQAASPVPSNEPSSLFDLAYRHHLAQSAMPPLANNDLVNVALIASSIEDLLKKIEQVKQVSQDAEKKSLRDPRGVLFHQGPKDEKQQVAFLFPGQGSQQLDMLRDLSLAFGEFRTTFENANDVLFERFEKPLSKFVYPEPSFNEDIRKAQSLQLTDTHVAQPAVAAADIASLYLLKSFGLQPDMVAGHSFGEYVALAAAGVMSENDLFVVAERRGAILKEANTARSGSMMAVSAQSDQVRALIAPIKDVSLANINSPKQCIISGELGALEQAAVIFSENKIKAKPIAVSAAFHSPLMHSALRELSQALLQVTLKKANITVFSNTLATPYPTASAKIASLLCEHLVKPVEFQAEIENMYEAGARIFIECGPGSVLSGLVDDILEGKEHLTLSLERNGKHGVTQLQNLLAQAFVAGLDVDFGRLYKHRVEGLLPKLEAGAVPNKPKLLYLVNGGQVKRIDGKNVIAANRPTEYSMKLMAQGSVPATASSAPAASAGPARNTASLNNNFAMPNVGAQTAAPVSRTDLPRTTLPNAGAQQATASGHSPASQPATTGNPPVPAPTAYPLNALNMAQPGTSILGLNFPAQPISAAGTGSAREQVLLEFQRTMLEMTSSFLKAQEEVMLAYLQGNRNAMRGAMQMPAANPLLTPLANPYLDQLANPLANFVTPQAANPAINNLQAAALSPSVADLSTVASASASALLHSMQDTVSSVSEHIASVQSEKNIAEHIQPFSGKSDSVPTNGNGNGDMHYSNNGKNGSSSSAALDPEFLTKRLIEIVSERTGYPADMLDPTLDLEADLGIDSIKRVEILNSFRKLLPEDVQTQLESGIEKLAGTKTLEGIISWINNDLVSPSSSPVSKDEIIINGGATPGQGMPGTNGSHPHGSNGASGSNGSSASGVPSTSSLNPTISVAMKSSGRHAQALQNNAYIERALVVLKDLPSLTQKVSKLQGTFIISDNGTDLTRKLQSDLLKLGAKVMVLKHKVGADTPPPFDISESQKFELDLTDETIVQSFAAKFVEKTGRIAGLIHLLPLSAGADHKDPLLHYLPIRSLYVLSRAFLALPGSADQTPMLITTSSMGGGFGINEPENIDPVQAALPGFVKTFAREYTQSVARCLDFAADYNDEKIKDVILLELNDRSRDLTEVGYKGSVRSAVDVKRSVLTVDDDRKLKLKQGSLVLVTGGARGITADLCMELTPYKPTFVIVGRGTRPPQEEPEYRGIEGQKELKAVIMDSLRKKGEKLSVPVIEGIYQRLLREREIRTNLERLEATGSRVHYHSLDVRNREQFSELIDRLYESFGKIDAVIHGAGVIEDAFVKDKPLASFDRVFGTKVDAALTLASRLQLDSLKYLVLFSSVVGRAGNAGQADYVCANEVLNKLARKLNTKTDARVVSIAWGPWRGGMAQPELESLFARYGWSMIESMEGRKAFLNELTSGEADDSEVLLVGQLKKPDNSADSAPNVGLQTRSDTKAALGKNVPVAVRLQGAEVLKQHANHLDLRLRIDPEYDLYLKDHAFDAVPILPMAVATEFLAEAAQLMYPDLQLEAIDKLQIPAGIMFESGAKDLFISVKEVERSEDGVIASVSISTGVSATRRNFSAHVVMTRNLKGQLPVGRPFKHEFEMPEIRDLEMSPPTVTQVYKNWLFHGPMFQGLEKIDAIGSNGITGLISTVPVTECLNYQGSESWIVDPILLDSAMQLAGIWARHYMDITVLPIGFGKLRFYAAPEGKYFKVFVSVPSESKSGELLCDMAVYDQNDKLVLLMEDLQGAGSKSLNRLGSQAKALRAR